MSELLQILTGKPAEAPKAQKYEPFDAAVRTIIAEESDPAAQEWVAGVIANRARKGGKDFYEIVTEKGQFEPWARGTAQAVDPNSEAYRQVSERVRDILEGKRDPSEGATHFYAPEAQAKLGREKPSWDDGTGRRVGNTLFFREPGSDKGSELASIVGAGDVAAAEQAFAQTFGNPEKFDQDGAGLVSFTKGPGSLDKAQTELLGVFESGNFIDRNEPSGSVRNPMWMGAGDSEKDVPPGAYYVTRGKDAQLKRAEGGETEGDFLRGASRGVGDVLLSLGNVMPGAEDSAMRNRFLADQMAYDAELKGNLVSGLGRFTGQAAASTLGLAGAEAVALPALGGSAVGRFLLGKGGAEMAPGVGRFLTRAGSLGASGAGEGALAAALVSSASDAPLEEQLKTGAIVGGALKPVLPAVAGIGQKAGEAVRNFAEPWTFGGREKAIDRLLGRLAPDGISPDLRELVPGSSPTLGEASGNAGIAALERNARTNPKLAQLFAERAEGNATARREFFETVARDPEAIADAKAARDAATTTLREEAFAGAGAADPTNVIVKIDEILKGPSGQRDVVVKALTNIRGKVSPEGGPQTDVEQLYGIRKAIDDTLSPLGPSEARGAQLATRELMEVKGALDKAIEGAAPGFKEYLKTYAEMSRPIDEMELLQGLNLTDSKGNLTLAKVQGALDRIDKQKLARGVNKGKSVSAETVDALKALRDDLKRAADIDKGRARGSDTAANLVMDRFTEAQGIPLAEGLLSAKIPGAGFVLGAANRAAAERNDKMLMQLASRLLQPELNIPQVAAKPRPRILPVDQVSLPVIGAIGASSLTNPK